MGPVRYFLLTISWPLAEPRIGFHHSFVSVLVEPTGHLHNFHTSARARRLTQCQLVNVELFVEKFLC